MRKASQGVAGRTGSAAPIANEPQGYGPPAPGTPGCRGASGGHNAERSDKAQACDRVEPEECHHDAQRAYAGTDQIGSVDPGDEGVRSRQGQHDAGCGAEERYDQHRVDREEVSGLARVPDDLERVERQSLGERKAGRSTGRKEQRESDECCRVMLVQPWPEPRP